MSVAVRYYSRSGNTKAIADYTSSPARDCPLCKAGVKLDGLVNTFGISTF